MRSPYLTVSTPQYVHEQPIFHGVLALLPIVEGVCKPVTSSPFDPQPQIFLQRAKAHPLLVTRLR